MQNFLSRSIGRFSLIAPMFFLTLGLLFPLATGAASSAPDPNDPNNLLNINACQNFSTESVKTITYKYVLNGNPGEVSADMYPNLAKCLGKLKMETSAPSAPHAQQEDTDDTLVINNVPQTNYLKGLAANIEKITPDKNDQARIVASIVQKFKYDANEPNNFKYPYDVAYQKSGICNETSKLILSLLKQMGFGTAMLTFEKADHQAAGVKCDPKYSYQGTGYCFIEPTTRAIITDTVGTNEKPRINVLSDGLAFDASKDFQDAQKYTSLLKQEKGKKMNPVDTDALTILQKTYGLD
ncbi:MAG TPA: hypothetical protein VK254_03570 [Candidatus Bathyarchaeia archaeon]|nr:hypothetical protein [Candidatus Bathyarchaeia archaeon]